MGRRIREVLATGAFCAALIAVAPGAAEAITAAQDPAKPDYDARSSATATIPQATLDARATLAKALGPQASVAADPVTGGLRTVGRSDGFLTDPSNANPAAIALGYVRDHAAAFGLDGSDVATLKLASSTTSPADRVTHLVFAQLDHGVGAYDSALLANVSADGQLINVGGAPVHDLAPPSTSPPLGPGAARSAAQQDLGVTPDGDPGTTANGDAARTTAFGDGDRAQLVTLADPGGDHLAWKLTVAGTGGYTYEVLVDAATGSVLTRHSLTDAFDSDANVVEHHPGDGTLDPADPTNIGPWLPDADHGLKGPNVHAYPDRFFPDGLGAGPAGTDEDIDPSSGDDFAFTMLTSGGPGDPLHNGTTPCPASGCTWDGSSIGDTWATANLGEAATQAFYYTNKYHDWLRQSPIGFDSASFSFDSSGATADPLNVEVDDYSQVNNSNFTTPPDGVSPTMQLGLYHAPFPAVNSADDATLVYHEYTHGLTNRLVGGDGQANGLIARQSQAMGEGWSDWYALDFLTAEGQISDDPATPGDEVIGDYVSGNSATGLRTNAVDCHVADRGPHCPGSTTAGPGGFTLGDLGKVADYDADHPYFEVHNDGEIWAETLWDLRQQLDPANPAVARRVITSALRLAQKQPSFLDMRNYILQAATLAGGTALRNRAWTVFAARGMGYSARISSANATHATEAFDTPPAAAPGAPSVASLPLEQDTPLTIPISNPGSATLSGVHATLTANSPGVTVTQGSADLGALAAGASAPAAFAVRVNASAGCGTVASATLTLTTPGAGTQSFPVTLPIGTGRSGAFTQVVAAPGSIPDNYGSSRRDLTSTLTIPATGRIGALRVTLAATHAWMGDLQVTLTSPSRTTVNLMERPGVDTTGFFSRANLVASTPLIFDDTAPNEIQDILNTEMTVSGPWRPNEPLARFAGEPRNGTWTLHVSDLGASNTGTVSSWSLETDDPACAITDAPTGLNEDDATFHARLDPGTASGTTVQFELGRTTAYGFRSPATTLTAGGGLQSFAVSSGGLTEGQTYHVRAIVVRGGTVVAAGADQAFVAGSQPTPNNPRDGGNNDPGTPPGGGGSPGGDGSGTGGNGSGTNDGQSTNTFRVPKATMKSLVRTVRLDRKGQMVLTMRATPGRAKGSIKLASGKASLGSKSFTVPSDGRVKITVKATKKLLALVKRHTAGVKAKVTLRIGVTPFTATLTIKPYKKPATKARG